LESIYGETKKQWAFYTPTNIEKEITSTIEAQRHVSADIEVTVRETENAMAELQVEDDGNCNRYSVHL